MVNQIYFWNLKPYFRRFKIGSFQIILTDDVIWSVKISIWDKYVRAGYGCRGKMQREFSWFMIHFQCNAVLSFFYAADDVDIEFLPLYVIWWLGQFETLSYRVIFFDGHLPWIGVGIVEVVLRVAILLCFRMRRQTRRSLHLRFWRHLRQILTFFFHQLSEKTFLRCSLILYSQTSFDVTVRSFQKIDVTFFVNNLKVVSRCITSILLSCC